MEQARQHVRSAPRRPVLVVNPGADVYGSDLQMLESVSAVLEAGDEVVVLLPGSGPLCDLITARGAQWRHLDYPVVRRANLSRRGIVELAGTLLSATPKMLSLLGQIAPSVVYVNTTTIPWWIGAARARRIPVVCHVHEAESADNRWVLRALNAPLLLANRLLVISQTSAQATWSVIPSLRRRSRIVFNGVPDRASPPVPPPAREHPGGPVRLAVVGRLSPRKGTDVAVRACAELVRSGHDVELEVAGSVFPGYEWFEKDLRELAATEGIADRVTFSGYVWPSFVVFDRADLVLAPSLREPFGNAVVEAQLSCRPVVAAAAGGHTESIVDGRTGVLVPPGDPSATAAAVAALIEDPQRAADIAEQARGSAVERFGLPRYRREVLAVIRELTDPPRTHRSVAAGGPDRSRPLRVLTHLRNRLARRRRPATLDRPVRRVADGPAADN